jgi:hypothetical protein
MGVGAISAPMGTAALTCGLEFQGTNKVAAPKDGHFDTNFSKETPA